MPLALGAPVPAGLKAQWQRDVQHPLGYGAASAARTQSCAAEVTRSDPTHISRSFRIILFPLEATSVGN